MVNRVQQILLQIVNSSGPLTSSTIAERLNVSGRTVVAEMPSVARELSQHGARLISRRNWGYSYAVEDRSAFEELVSNLEMLAMQIEVAGYDETSRFLYIARRLIAAEDGVRLDEIAEELSVSRSALRIPLRRAYSFLESYHLQIVSSPGRGIVVRGEEHLLRLAMGELFASHFHKAKLGAADAGYAGIISCDWKERQDIRHVYLEVQRSCGWALRDSRTQRVAMLLVISRNRIASGFPVRFSDSVFGELACTPQFKCASNVVDRLADNFSGFDFDNHERAFIALYMIVSLTLDLGAQDSRMPLWASGLSQEPCDAVISGLKDKLGCRLFEDPSSRALLCQAISSICIASHFGMDGCEHFDHENEKSAIESPLCMALASWIAEEIVNCSGCRASESDVRLIASVIAWTLFKVEYEVAPLRLLVTDGMGTEFARQKGEALRKVFPELIESVNPFELYEIRGLEEADYDAALVDAYEVSYSYVYPMAHLRSIEWCEGFAAIHDNILLDAYQLDGLLFARDEISVRVQSGAMASREEALGLLGVPRVRRICLFGNDPASTCPASGFSIVVDFVEPGEDERLALLSCPSSGGKRGGVLYVAVDASKGERHVKAVERLLYLFRDGVPDDFECDPALVCYRTLRSSLCISSKGC